MITQKVNVSKSIFSFFVIGSITSVTNATSCSSSTLEEQEDLEGDETGRGLEWPGKGKLKGDSSGYYNLAGNLPGTISWVSSLQLKLV